MATATKTASKSTKAKPAAAKPAIRTAAQPAAKPAAKPAVAAKKPAVKKAVAAKPAAAKSGKAKAGAISPEQRRCYVEVAAYYIAERRGFNGGSELDDWVQAEAEIDRLLKEGILNP